MKFPIIILGPENSLDIVQDEKILFTTNKLGLKNKIYHGNIIVDCNENFYETIDAKKIKNIYPFWKFEFFNPLIQVELITKKSSSKYSFLELKDKILKIIRINKEQWESYIDFEELLISISNSKTIKELIIKMSGFFGE